MFPSRSFLIALVVAVAAGAALGFLAPSLEVLDSPAAHVAHLVLAAGWSWGALAFCAGLARQSRIESAALGAISLIVGVIVYYLTKLARSQFLTADIIEVDWSGSKTFFWCLAASFLGVIVGLAGNLARDGGFRGLPFRLMIPLLVIVETTQRLRFEAPLQGPVVGMTWSLERLAAVAAVIVLIAGAAINSRRRRSVGQYEESPLRSGRQAM
ncbi:DUF6518 family protein [Streptomyces sp. NPDC059861]|uniref:DUF6518 family protein n=1 Tax=Streptomyces sp. NPDC059861 TaxID=3346974 RepID=UPI003648986B